MKAKYPFCSGSYTRPVNRKRDEFNRFQCHICLTYQKIFTRGYKKGKLVLHEPINEENWLNLVGLIRSLSYEVFQEQKEGL